MARRSLIQAPASAPAADHTSQHTKQVRDILVALSARGDCTVLENKVGARKLDDGTWFRYGIPGTPDIIGFADGGLWIGLEVKTGTGRPSPSQKAFRSVAMLRGAQYAVVHSVDEAHAAIDALIDRALKHSLVHVVRRTHAAQASLPVSTTRRRRSR